MEKYIYTHIYLTKNKNNLSLLKSYTIEMNMKIEEQTINFSEYKDKCFQLLQVNDALNIAIEDKNREIARLNERRSESRIDDNRLKQLYLENEELNNTLIEKNREVNKLYEQSREYSTKFLRADALLTVVKAEAADGSNKLKKLLTANENLNLIIEGLAEEVERGRSELKGSQARSEQRIAALLEEKIKLSEMNTSQTSIF